MLLSQDIRESAIMLTSSASQYLHPDYMQPLPTSVSLDPKNSPLALLAQTCSSIGKDSNSAKSIIPPLDKKDAKDKESRKSISPKSGSGGDKGRRSSHSSDRLDAHSPSSARGSDSPKGGFRAPAPKDIPPLVPISSSTSDKSSSSSSSRCSPKTSTSSDRDRERDRETTSVTSVIQSSVPSTSTSSSGAHSNSRISLSCGNMLLEVNHHESAAKALGLPPSAHHHALASSLKGDVLSAPSALHPGLGAYPSLPLFGHPLQMDASSMYSSLSGHAALASAHKGLSPYVSYARVKTTTGATTLVPVCKDPYCTHCQMTMQSAQLTSSAASGACAAGCTQCTHEKTFPVPTSLSAHHSGLMLQHSASSLSLSSLYPHAFGGLPGAHGLPPYVCNWMAGSDYCGKRFTTSEELLQHLRTHTSSSEAAAVALSHAGFPYSALAPSLAACHSHYPGSLSPNTLRQAYPRSLSPNTLLAANRYHPYKSPLSSLSTPPVGASGLPSLAAYYSPYSLYGQRLGAT